MQWIMHKQVRGSKVPRIEIPPAIFKFVSFCADKFRYSVLIRPLGSW